MQLTSLVTCGGIAVALAATVLELLGEGGRSAADGIEIVLVACGVLCLIQTIVVAALIPRMRRERATADA